MFKIGCHLSSSKGFTHMLNEACSIQANTFQFFTRNPRGGKAKEIDENDLAQYLNLSSKSEFQTILAHAPYTLNPASSNPKIRDFAHLVFSDDLSRMELVPENYYNFHPGAHVGQGVETGINLIVDLVNAIIKPDQTTLFLLETMSGSGTEIGSTFEELKQILNRVQLPKKMGVCLDTCHVFAAGYDIKNNLEGVLEQFDCVIGLEKLKAIHLNDSLTPFGSHKDRHAAIGCGEIGLDAIARIINHPALKDKLFVLETPQELEGYQKEIALLRSLRN